MSTASSSPSFRPAASGPHAAGLPWPGIDLLRSAHRLFWLNACAYLLLFVSLLVLMMVDERLFQGVSVWKKPAKFALSLGVLFGTFAWFAALLPAEYWRSRAGRTLTWLALGTAAFEMAYIAGMAGLGQASHFNVSTLFTGVMYSLMGIGATVLVTTCLWLGIAIARRSPGWFSDPVRLAVVLGLMLTFLLGGGFGGYLGSQMGHWVNASPTDANGLLLFDWARDGGDLRVAHFFGMHAMQALPLFALLVVGTRGDRARPMGLARASVFAFAVLYAGVCIATFVQALMGLPLI